MKYNCYLLLFTSFLITGCKTSSIVGIYSQSKYNVSHTLELMSDKSFRYSIEGDIVSQTSGSWSKSNGRIFLNSHQKFAPYIVQELKDSIDRLFFIIKDIDGIVFKGNYVQINDTSQNYYLSDLGEISIYPRKEINSFCVFSFNGRFMYNIKDKESNNFNISFDSKKNDIFYMENEEYKLRLNKLVKKGNRIKLIKKT